MGWKGQRRNMRLGIVGYRSRSCGSSIMFPEMDAPTHFRHYERSSGESISAIGRSERVLSPMGLFLVCGFQSREG